MKRTAVLFGLLLVLTSLAWVASGQYITGGTKGPTGATGPTGPTGAQGPGGVTSSCAGTTPFVLYMCQTVLMSGQIATASSLPITNIVAAPGMGKVLLYRSISTQVVLGTIPFFSSLTGSLTYTGLPGTPLDLGAVVNFSGSFGGVSPFFSFASAVMELVSTVDRVDVESKGFTLTGNVDDPTGAINVNTCPVAGGTGYVVNDTFTVDGGGVGPPNAPAAGVVDTIGGGGAVTACHLISNGSGYVPAVGASTTATLGIGTGLTVTITSITPANGTARVWITYMVLALP